jgi:hypothetical protein
MRLRTAVAASAALLCAAGAMSPALAAPTGGVVKGSWTTSPTPPNPTGNNPAGSAYCEPTGGIGRATMELKIPGPGSLEFNLNNTLDWSADVRDKATGDNMGQSDGGSPQDKESVQVTFKKATTVILGACNLEGEPTVTATYLFTPKKKK